MKVNSLQLLGTVVDNYSMDSFFDYYVGIQIQREKEDLHKIFLYEFENRIHEEGYYDDGEDRYFDDYEPEYFDEEDLLARHGFEQ